MLKFASLVLVILTALPAFAQKVATTTTPNYDQTEITVYTRTFADKFRKVPKTEIAKQVILEIRGNDVYQVFPGREGQPSSYKPARIKPDEARRYHPINNAYEGAIKMEIYRKQQNAKIYETYVKTAKGWEQTRSVTEKISETNKVATPKGTVAKAIVAHYEEKNNPASDAEISRRNDEIAAKEAGVYMQEQINEPVRPEGIR